jgi:DNA-binding FrmR family transcriptional regulator
MNLLEDHMNCCVKHAFESNDKKEIDDKIKELIKVVRLAQDK